MKNNKNIVKLQKRKENSKKLKTRKIINVQKKIEIEEEEKQSEIQGNERV